MPPNTTPSPNPAPGPSFPSPPNPQPVQPNPQPPVFNNPSPPPPQGNKRNLVKIILLVLAGLVVLGTILITVIIMGVNSATKEPQIVSNQLVDAVQAGDSSKVIELSSSAFKEAATEEEVKDLVQRISPLLSGEEKITGKKIEKIAGNPARAVFNYSIKTPDGEKYMRVIVEEENESWKVLNFRSSENPLELEVE